MIINSFPYTNLNIFLALTKICFRLFKIGLVTKLKRIMFEIIIMKYPDFSLVKNIKYQFNKDAIAAFIFLSSHLSFIINHYKENVS